ncbi:MAG: CBS domain containing-hemolysin-like protein [Hyphomicrobiaceae bacterium]|jgi:CBS domain containing-hemolysin-like protein
MSPWITDLAEIGIALLLVFINGFFVAAEFALVKVRPGRIDELVAVGRPAATTAAWLAARMEMALSACQLGITMASLALGWVGEPAFAHLLEPALQAAGVQSATVLHTLSFIVSFSTITALHLVVGEQAPKIFAIRRPENMLLWCAIPLRMFYAASWPLMAGLNKVTQLLLATMGMDSAEGHDTIHTETELQTLLSESFEFGHLSRSEHKLINAVFRFDDMICRRVMVPRAEVDFLDINVPATESLTQTRRSKHTRYPVCNGSLDEVLGVVHVKDLVGVEVNDDFDWTAIMRPPKKIPENLPISRVLRHFQATHQLMAFVIDEYGTVIGLVTLENVLEVIIGDVDDEFDINEPDVVPDGPGRFLITGGSPAEDACRLLGIKLGTTDVDTFSGLLMERAGKVLSPGDIIVLGNWTAEVLDVRGDIAKRVRVTKNANAS